MMIELVEFGESAIFIVMLLASILAVAVVVERVIVYNRTTKKSEAFFKEILSSVRARNWSKTKELTADIPDSAYSRFTDFSVEQKDSGKEALGEMMDGQIITERLELEKRLPILNTLGNNTPFIGLLGTVLGVIKAFHGLGTLGNSGAEVVMRSISTALLATAAGLGIAIPVVMANNYFTRKMKVILGNLEILSKEFLASFSSQK